MEPEPFWYAAGAAGSGRHRARQPRGVRPLADRAADAHRATARNLSDDGARHARSPAPVLTAPVGVQCIMHPDGELAVARASRRARAPDDAVDGLVATRWRRSPRPTATASAGSSCTGPTTRRCARASSRGPKAAGFSALVVTLDTWMLGWRPHDLDHAYLPFLTGKGLATYFTDPAFRAGLEKAPEEDLQAARPALAADVHRHRPHLGATSPSSASTGTGRSCSRASSTSTTRGGRPTPGMDGIVVSNHGGRQVDGAIASLDALPGDRRRGRRPARGAVRLRHPHRRGRPQGGRPRREGGARRPAVGVRARARRLGRRAARAAQPARRPRPHPRAVRQRQPGRSRPAHPAAAMSGVTARA